MAAHQPLADQDQELIARLIHIGAQLSSERNLEHLLELIVEQSRHFTRADGGTLFLVDTNTQTLRWAIIQNETMRVHIGGRNNRRPDANVFPPIPLQDDAQEHLTNVAAAVAKTGQIVNIQDVYDEHDAFDFAGPQRFDAQTGYRTRSMLVVPLTHFEGGVVGVLQLINARDELNQLIPFDPRFEALTSSLASQAAVAIKNAQLFDEIEAQFEAFIRTIATAIDEKSPYTSGHVRRVVDITLRIAHAVNAAEAGPFAQTALDHDALKALRVAAWMHDIGKIATPEHVVDKATKLSTIFDRISLIEARFDYIRRDLELTSLKQQLSAPSAEHQQQLKAQLEQDLIALAQDLELLRVANQGQEFMSDEHIAHLERIAQQTYLDPRGVLQPRLTPNELENLCVRRGTLTADEIEIIREHANISYKMLSQLPFSRHLADVPEIAAGHHEKLNGKGYPRGLSADQLSLPARILAVADIFEALTAADRPYKKPSPLSTVKRILESMVNGGDIDPDVVQLAMQSGVFDDYAAQEISPEQRDHTFTQS